MQKRKHRERQLQRQHNLAQGQKISDATVAPQSDDQNGGKDGEASGNETPHPGPDSPMHEAFHHHLPGQCARDRAALPAGEQRHRKQGARQRSPKQRRERQVSDANPI